MSVSIDEFKITIEQKGWIILKSVIPPELVKQMKIDLHKCYHECRKLQISNNISIDTPYTVHHLIGQSASYLEYLELNIIDPYLKEYFEGEYILNSFGGAINKAGSKSYANRIHRDIRTFSGESNLMLNTLLMLDDFTAENGATELLSGSHKLAEKPSDKIFIEQHEKAIAPSGSILLFNSNTWHAGGENKTSSERCSVTPMYSKPFMKQQFDYCRNLGFEVVEQMSPKLQQVLGFYSRTPTTLEEWYQPPEKRMYRVNQG